MDCKQLQMSRSVGPLLSVGVPRVNMSICGKTDALGKCLTNYNLILKCPTGKWNYFSLPIPMFIENFPRYI